VSYFWHGLYRNETNDKIYKYTNFTQYASTETIIRYQGVYIISYPILDFLRRILFDHVEHAFTSCCRIEHIGDYL